MWNKVFFSPLFLCFKDYFLIILYFTLKTPFSPFSNGFFCRDVLTCLWLSVCVFVAVDVVLFIHLSSPASAFVDSSTNGGPDD